MPINSFKIEYQTIIQTAQTNPKAALETLKMHQKQIKTILNKNDHDFALAIQQLNNINYVIQKIQLKNLYKKLLYQTWNAHDEKQLKTKLKTIIQDFKLPISHNQPYLKWNTENTELVLKTILIGFVELVGWGWISFDDIIKTNPQKIAQQLKDPKYQSTTEEIKTFIKWINQIQTFIDVINTEYDTKFNKNNHQNLTHIKINSDLSIEKC